MTTADIGGQCRNERSKAPVRYTTLPSVSARLGVLSRRTGGHAILLVGR